MNKENIEEKSEEATLEQVISNEDSDFKEIDNSIVKEEIKNNISSTSQQTIKEEQKHLDNQNEYIQTEINTEVNNSQNVESKPETNSSEAALVKQQTVTIYRSNGSILEIELEEYIVGVVAAEMPASFSSEALKAQAVVARTYALKRVSTGQKLTDTVSTQAYIDVSQMKQKWGNDFSKYYNKIKKAVEETTGEYITYNGEYINAVYHSTSNGYTEDAKNVWQESYPYLKSVESIWDKNVSSYQRTITKDYNNLLDVTGLSDENLEINILNRNTSGRVETIQVGNNIYTGVEFRNLLGLRSTDFDIEFVDGNIQITTRGYGHGVGMSQYGANEMSKQGYNYRQIIGHYYTGVQIQK